ncbi:OmpA family protein [Wenyingzhuangia sp. IMCC45574]
MRTHTLILFICVAFFKSYSQEILPPNAEEGKCYVRYLTEDRYEKQNVQVEVKPSYKILKKYPAVYKTVEEKVLVKPETTRSVIMPAVWGVEQISYVKKEESSLIQLEEVAFKDSVITLETSPSSTKWQYNLDKKYNCTSNESENCRTWIQKVQPAKFFKKEVIVTDTPAIAEITPITETTSIYEVKVIVEQERIEQEVIPAVYKKITKMVLVKDAYVEEEEIPAIYEYYLQDVLVEKAGEVKWREIGCEFVTYKELDMVWESTNARLLQSSQDKIDQVLMPLLINHPGVKIEIKTETISEGKEKANRFLSQKRAKSILNHLKVNGINSELLLSNIGSKEIKNKNYTFEDYKIGEGESVKTRVFFRLVP